VRGRFGKDSELNFRFSVVGGKYMRSTASTEALPVELGRFTLMLKLLDWPNCIESEGRPAFLPAICAVADADAQRLAACEDLRLPA